VTNEVNFYRFAPDASDSAYDRARRALVRGVEAAHRLVRRLGFDDLKVGFNWAYRTDPNREARFWWFLREHGGKRFARSVDWVGLDAYPGTVFPPTEPPVGTGYRDGMVNAMSQLRECFMPIARLGRDIPIHVEENGWPTGPGRPESEQVRALRQMVGAVNDFRGTYNVTDYRWFDLRDHNSSGPNFQQHYGLLRDDYSPKPAFGAYRDPRSRDRALDQRGDGAKGAVEVAARQAADGRPGRAGIAVPLDRTPYFVGGAEPRQRFEESVGEPRLGALDVPRLHPLVEGGEVVAEA
jgi:hypothetical protein